MKSSTLPATTEISCEGAAFHVCILVQRIDDKYLLRVGTTCWVVKTTLSLCLSVYHLLHIVHNTEHLNLQLNFITK